MNKFVVFTVLTGNYEEVQQPALTDSRFDYILFTNDVPSSAGVWSVRPIPEVLTGDNKRLSRYPKTHPETLLAEYKASLYMDANIQIRDQWVYDRVVELYEKGVEFAGIKLVLTGRDCIYEHSFDICQWHVETQEMAIRQCHAMYEQGFPQHFGLNENNVIYRLHTERMKAADQEWWDWILKYSSRDQFSYMFCLWHNGVALDYFLPEGEDTRNSTHFLLVNHNDRIDVKKSKTIKPNIIKRMMIKNNSISQDRALKIWRTSYRSRFPVLVLDTLSFLFLFVNTPAIIRALIKKIKKPKNP